MATRPKFFSWSKGRQSASEPYHRTGGLLPIIDTTVDHDSTEALLANDIEVRYDLEGRQCAVTR